MNLLVDTKNFYNMIMTGLKEKREAEEQAAQKAAEKEARKAAEKEAAQQQEVTDQEVSDDVGKIAQEAA